MSQVNFNTVKAGQTVNMVVRGREDVARFRGFTQYVEQYSETPAFDTLKEAKDWTGCKTNKALEVVGEHLGYGHNVYAVFTAWGVDGDAYNFTCYLFNGRWTCGSGADAVKLEAA